MRSFCFALLMGSILMPAMLAYAQDDDPGDIFGSSDSSDSEKSKDASSSAPKDTSSPASGETIMDSETIKADASGRLIDADFISLGGTAAWLDRNGLGAHLGFGGYTCMREYCRTTLDAQYFGSISLIPGVYYRLNPNWSLFADITIARLRTNMRSSSALGITDIGDNHGVAFQFIIGPAFHLPVRGWLDLYTSLGIGPIALREKTDSDYKHRWGGFDIEWTLGANLYFWSVGPLKNFSVGPFMKFGFPIWPKVCVQIEGNDECDKPSTMNNEYEGLFLSETPFTFQLGLEARYEFSITGKPEKPTPAASMETDGDTKNDDAKKDDAKKDDKKEGDEKDGETGDDDDDDDSDGEADAEASAEASISL